METLVYERQRAEFNPPYSVAATTPNESDDDDDDSINMLEQEGEHGSNVLLLEAHPMQLHEHDSISHLHSQDTSSPSPPNEGLQALIMAASIREQCDDTQLVISPDCTAESRDPPVLPSVVQGNGEDDTVKQAHDAREVFNPPMSAKKHHHEASQNWTSEEQRDSKRPKLYEDGDISSKAKESPSYQRQWEIMVPSSASKGDQASNFDSELSGVIKPSPSRRTVSCEHDQRQPAMQHRRTAKLHDRFSIWRRRNEGLRRGRSDESFMEANIGSYHSEMSQSCASSESNPPSPSAVITRRIKRVSFSCNSDLPRGFPSVPRGPFRPRKRSVTHPAVQPRTRRTVHEQERDEKTRRVRFLKHVDSYTAIDGRAPASVVKQETISPPAFDRYITPQAPQASVTTYRSPSREFSSNRDSYQPPMQVDSDGAAAVKTWACDICHHATFSNFEEACAHEKMCQGQGKPSEGGPVTVPSRQNKHIVSLNTISHDDVSASEETADAPPMTRDDQGASRAKMGDSRESIGGQSFSWYSGRVPLAVSKDSEWLSDLNCFIRKRCIEAFSATEEDVLTTSKRGRIAMDQVGIRCAFCAPQSSSQRAVAAVSYPVSISGIYESVKRWQRVHLPACEAIPVEVKQEIEHIQATCVWVPTTRQYWSDSAKALGMVDTEDGIRFERDPLSPGPVDDYVISSPVQNQTSSPHALVRPEDKDVVPTYVYVLMEQVKPCRFTEADRFLARSKGPIGFAGFECKHCSGHAGLGKYFPTSAKSLSTNSTSQNIHSHLMKCRRCPQAVKDELETLKDCKAKSVLLHGWRRTFFDRVWVRLHG